ncbi:MAG: hypothetical protein ACRDJE_02845, partial [Dehalococcoidia bacterium]
VLHTPTGFGERSVDGLAGFLFWRGHGWRRLIGIPMIASQDYCSMRSSRSSVEVILEYLLSVLTNDRCPTAAAVS